jgi:hypothetical protein
MTKFPAADVTLYFATLVSQDPDTWGGLGELPEANRLPEARSAAL